MTVTDTASAQLDRLQRQWRGRADTRFVAADDADLPGPAAMTSSSPAIPWVMPVP
ncbi:MAG: hypothetical protein HPM95_17780 [Alphaproteobacteria bacterium]|nr:hypothetical protein [Alphaproteobacteria bacterium]